MDESVKVKTSKITKTCKDLLDERPTESTSIEMHDFMVGKRSAKLDLDGDEKFDLVGVPLFSKDLDFKKKYGYYGVILCAKGIETEAQYEALLGGEEEVTSLAVDYWPQRQKLETALHSKLAQQYRSLDFAKSPVVLYGFERENPLLGKTTYQFSILAGIGSLAVAALTILISVLMGFLKKFFQRTPKPTAPKPVANRAGLPASEAQDSNLTGGVLDRVRSRRNQPES